MGYFLVHLKQGFTWLFLQIGLGCLVMFSDDGCVVLEADLVEDIMFDILGFELGKC